MHTYIHTYTHTYIIIHSYRDTYSYEFGWQFVWARDRCPAGSSSELPWTAIACSGSAGVLRRRQCFDGFLTFGFLAAGRLAFSSLARSTIFLMANLNKRTCGSNRLWIRKSGLCATSCAYLIGMVAPRLFSLPFFFPQTWSCWASPTCDTGGKPDTGAGLFCWWWVLAEHRWPGNKVVNTNDIAQPHPPRLGCIAFWSCVWRGPGYIHRLRF